MKNKITKAVRAILIFYLGIGSIANVSMAKDTFSSKEELLKSVNDDINTMYNRGQDYYVNEATVNGKKLKLRQDLLEKGVEFANHIATWGTRGLEQDEYRKFRLAYGEGFTLGSGQGVDEYYGYNRDGALIENPDYHWNLWDGKMIQDRNYIREPWKNGDKISVRPVKSGLFNKERSITYSCPDGTKKTLEDAIQTGLNIRFGSKTASEVVYNSKSSDIVYISGTKPKQGGGWIDYVDIVQPPTYYSWGQGYMYLEGGTRYMGVDIAPYCMVGDDLGVIFEQTLPGKTKTGQQVTITAHSTSTFKNNMDTYYRWTVVGATTGEEVQKIAYKVDDTAAGANGACNIPAGGKKRIFKVGFTMPEEPVNVTLEINYKVPYIEEGDYSNNKITYKVDWQPYLKSESDHTLHYNELSREIQHVIAKGGSSASVSKPKGDWDGEASGGLNVTIGETAGILQNAGIKEGTNDPVTGDVTSATRNPVLTGTIVRNDFGDDPDRYYASNSKDSVVKSFLINFEGQMSRPWKAVYTTTSTSTDSEGKTHTSTETHTETGTSTGDFVPGENLVKIKAEIYNGLETMPKVDARTFREEIDNNETDSKNKIIWWESDKYPMNVQRWMAHVYLNEPIEYEAVDGQYQRIFSQQNKATVTWDVKKDMETIYKSDRTNAKNSKRDKRSYQYVPFATDRELQRFDYPFKSGYYFNPAGEYSVTLETEIFKDQQGETQEHKELVNELIKSFRYTSTMQYKIDGSPSTLSLQIEDPQSSRYEEKSDDGLLVAEKDYTYVNDYEVMYSPNAEGFTHRYFKEILEGYEESETQDSKDKYQYREYIKEGEIYKIIETTTITFKVNPDNKPVYTYGGMKNGTYHNTAWVEDANIGSIINVSDMKKLVGIKDTTPLDHIEVTVQGSMYDDLNN